MSDNKTVAEQLEEAIASAEKAAKLVDELKKQSRENDLKEAKKLIERQQFTVTDLKPELKTRAAKATPRKSTRGRKSK